MAGQVDGESARHSGVQSSFSTQLQQGLAGLCLRVSTQRNFPHTSGGAEKQEINKARGRTGSSQREIYTSP